MQTLVRLDPTFGYGLGLFSVRTPCGTVWGHDGSVPGYVTVAYNSRRGDRNLVLMMNASPDAQTGPLLELTLGTAVCAMLGEPDDRGVPVPVGPGRSARSALQ